ncbi:unnamed protein product [Phaeothamnion confervicola]
MATPEKRAEAVDEVTRVQVYREIIRKENSIVLKPHKFSFNVHRLTFIARKPTEFDPRSYEEDSRKTREQVRMLEEKVRKNLEELRASDGNGPSTAIDKSIYWSRESDEYGCDQKASGAATTAASKKSCWNKPKNTSDITGYADYYYAMTQTSPFARKKEGVIKQ